MVYKDIMVFKEKIVFDRLRKVIDPELDIDIVRLGLIYRVKINKNKIRVVMTLTTPGCPLAPVIDQMVRDALFDLVEDPQEDLEIDLTFDPPWTPDMMDEETRLELGL